MAKGGEWERSVCKYLSKWINGTEKPYVFWRGAGSGAMFTKNENTGERFAGDIYSIREEGKFLTDLFVIECKSGYKEASIDKHLKYNNSDDIRDFWEQVNNDSKKINKYPMLIFRKKGFPVPWLFVNFAVWKQIKNHFFYNRMIHLKWDIELPDMYGFSYKEFFNNLTPEIIKNLEYKV